MITLSTPVDNTTAAVCVSHRLKPFYMIIHIIDHVTVQVTLSLVDLKSDNYVLCYGSD